MADLELSTVYAARQPVLTELAANLERAAKEALEHVAHVDRVSFRTKGAKSFIKKAELPKYESPLREIEDQVAGRVLVFFRSDIEPVSEVLRNLFGAVEWQRVEPDNDSEFGYESDHFICVFPNHHLPSTWKEYQDMPRTFELQVRTLFMHAWAEPQHDLGYKGVAPLPRDVNRKLAFTAASAWGADMAMDEIYRTMMTGQQRSPRN